MVESDHGEAAEDVKTTAMPGGGDVDGKKIELVGKRQREDSSEDEANELPSKRQRSEANDRSSEPERDAISEPVHKANGSSGLKDDTRDVDEEELSNDKLKNPSAKSEEKIDDAESSEEKDADEKAHNDTSVNSDKVEPKKESIENKDETQENTEKNDVSSEEKPEDDEEEEEEEEEDDDDEEVDDGADSSSKEKASVDKQSSAPSLSKSKTKDPEVVDGLEMSVECASDKEGSSSEVGEDNDEKKKLRPKTIIVKAKPNDSELDASTSGGEKSDVEEKEEKKSKKGSAKVGKSSPEGKGRKRGKKKGFTKVATSGSEDSDDNASEDEDYSPRTKKKMKRASSAKKSPAKTPGKRRGRTPKKLAKQSEDLQSDEQEDDDVNLDQRSKKGKTVNRKKTSGTEDEEKSEEETSESVRKNGKKKSKARPEDDKRIQALKKYFPMAGITIKSYEHFWAGCKTNTARLARMKEALALQGVVGRPTAEKCKKAKARMDLKKEVDSLSPDANLTEGRVTRARGGKKATPPKAETPTRRESRGPYKRVSTVIDSESE